MAAAVGVITLVAALALAAAPAQAEVVWLCKPGMADNPCELPQDTTYMESGGADRVVTPPSGGPIPSCLSAWHDAQCCMNSA